MKACDIPLLAIALIVLYTIVRLIPQRDKDTIVQPQEKQSDTEGGLSRLTLNYIVIAAVFFAIGLFVGGAALTPAPDNGAVQVDEAQIRGIIQSALEEHEFAAPAADEGPDRFALVDDDPYLGAVDAPVVIVEFSDFLLRLLQAPLRPDFPTPARKLWAAYPLRLPRFRPSH